MAHDQDQPWPNALSVADIRRIAGWQVEKIKAREFDQRPLGFLCIDRTWCRIAAADRARREARDIARAEEFERSRGSLRSACECVFERDWRFGLQATGDDWSLAKTAKPRYVPGEEFSHPQSPDKSSGALASGLATAAV